MDSLLDYLDEIEDILDESKTIPFSNKISVEKERIFNVISEIRLNLPHEIRQAQRIIEEHDKIIDEANAKASSIVKDAETEAKSLTNSHEIFRRASEQASDVLDEAKRDARDMRLNAMDYADGLLEEAESMIRQVMENMEQQYKILNDYCLRTIDVLYENRQELRNR